MNGNNVMHLGFGRNIAHYKLAYRTMHPQRQDMAITARHLHAAFDHIAGEDLPQDMCHLLQRLWLRSRKTRCLHNRSLICVVLQILRCFLRA